ncbi:MAG: amino acid ABC transporter substrate-binding protein, partial [Oscillibacter sp.]|nr:amino acid ABC transporter substrate-binding protein [Oscillibacter sp.]
MKRKQRIYLLDRPCVRQILALFLCFVLLSSNIPSAAADESPNNRTVKAGVFFFDGYHMRDDDGVYTGYGIELLNLISQYSHLNFEFVGYENTWEEMQSMLLAGEIDVVTSARRTRARTEIYGFSDPIERNSTVLSVLEGNTSIIPGDYSTYDGMTVGLLAGSSQNRTLPAFAVENGFTYQTLEYEYTSELEAALRSGEIDAILTSNLRRTEGESVLDTTNIDYFYAITRKDDQALLDEINYTISQMNLHEGHSWANNLYNKYYGTGEYSPVSNV